MAKNIYTHTIDLAQLNIRNAPRTEFAEKVREIEYRGFEVEQCADGRKVVITKPGGKRVFGHPKRKIFWCSSSTQRIILCGKYRISRYWRMLNRSVRKMPKKGKPLLLYLNEHFMAKSPVTSLMK